MTLETTVEIGLHRTSIPNNLYLISNLTFFYGFFIEQPFIEFVLMLSPDIVKNIIVLFRPNFLIFLLNLKFFVYN